MSNFNPGTVFVLFVLLVTGILLSTESSFRPAKRINSFVLSVSNLIFICLDKNSVLILWNKTQVSLPSS